MARPKKTNVGQSRHFRGLDYFERPCYPKGEINMKMKNVTRTNRSLFVVFFVILLFSGWFHYSTGKANDNLQELNATYILKIQELSKVVLQSQIYLRAMTENFSVVDSSFCQYITNANWPLFEKTEMLVGLTGLLPAVERYSDSVLARYMQTNLGE